jgi:hypothetical protein
MRRTTPNGLRADEDVSHIPTVIRMMLNTSSEVKIPVINVFQARGELLYTCGFRLLLPPETSCSGLITRSVARPGIK